MKQFLAIFTSLFLAGCDIHLDSVYLGRTESVFLVDVGRGDLEAVQNFLDKGGNVNLRDEPGMTPLHHAANADWQGSHLEMVKLLVTRGADVNALDDTRHTPLHLASCAETAAVLLDAGANVNAKTKRQGETKLFSAAWGAAQGAEKSHQTYLDLTQLLIARGGDVNAKLSSGDEQLRKASGIEDKPYHDKTGDTPLHQVVRSFSEKHAMIVTELLLNHGAMINATNTLGWTPLDEALANQRNQTADFLRNLGAQSGQPTKMQAK